MDELLSKLRKLRNFKAQDYLDKKIAAINKFFTDEKLDSAVVGLSGGVDSSLVLALLLRARKESNSPLKRIVGVIVPFLGMKGVTRQFEAGAKAVDFAVQMNAEFVVVEGSAAAQAIIKQMGVTGPWEEGQMLSILRTPIFYYQAAILQAKGYKSIVVGTTNRDEGSYIGFFGKASDAMVDLQPIADIHKSEVYQLAELLGIPDYITSDKPRGDVWDGKCDEEMVGAPYDFLEMYLLQKEFGLPCDMNETEMSTYRKYASNIEEIHSKNNHKYKVGNPARFIDVMPRKVEGGWR